MKNKGKFPVGSLIYRKFPPMQGKKEPLLDGPFKVCRSAADERLFLLFLKNMTTMPFHQPGVEFVSCETKRG